MKAKPAGALLDQRVERRQRCDRLIGIDRRDRAAQIAGQRSRIADRAHRERHRVRRRLADRPIHRVRSAARTSCARRCRRRRPRVIHGPSTRQLESLADRIARRPSSVAASAALTIATGGASARSESSNQRPRSSGIFIAAKYSLVDAADTRAKRASCSLRSSPSGKKRRLLLLNAAGMMLVGADRPTPPESVRIASITSVDEPPPRLGIAVVALGQIELRDQHVVLVEAEHAVDGPIGGGRCASVEPNSSASASAICVVASALRSHWRLRPGVSVRPDCRSVSETCALDRLHRRQRARTPASPPCRAAPSRGTGGRSMRMKAQPGTNRSTDAGIDARDRPRPIAISGIDSSDRDDATAAGLRSASA